MSYWEGGTNRGEEVPETPPIFSFLNRLAIQLSRHCALTGRCLLSVSGTVPILLKSTIYYHKAPLAISRGGRSEALGRSLCVIRVGIHQW